MRLSAWVLVVVAWDVHGDPLPTSAPADLGAGDLRLVAGSTTDRDAASSTLEERARLAIGGNWTIVEPPGFTKSEFGDTAPTLSRDGLELFYERHSAPNVSEIFRSVRPSLGVPFTTSERVNLTSYPQVGDPELSYDGRTLYFTVLLGDGHRIYYATREPL